MKIDMRFLDFIQGSSDWFTVKGFVRQQFEDLAAQIKVGWNKNHTSEGNHGDVVANSIVSANGYSEHGRSAAVGEWIALPTLTTADVFSDSGSWSFTLTNVVLRYTRIGKTIILTFRFFNNGTITGTPEFIGIHLPPELTAARLTSSEAYDDRMFSSVALSTVQGTAYAFIGRYPNQGSNSSLIFKRREGSAGGSGTWAATAGDFGLDGQIIYEAENF